MVEVLTSCLTLVHTVATDTMNDGTVAWTASAATTPAGGRYFIRVAATDGGNGGNHVAFSDSGEFDILAPTPTLSLVSIFDANEGGVWEKGSTEVVSSTFTLRLPCVYSTPRLSTIRTDHRFNLSPSFKFCQCSTNVLPLFNQFALSGAVCQHTRGRPVRHSCLVVGV